MIRALFFFIAVAALQFAASAQTAAPAGTTRTGEAAEAVAKRATGAFEQIDPDSEAARKDEAEAAYAGLPPLAPEAAQAPVQVVDGETPAPRGPAVRIIPQPVLQTIATAAPAPAAPSAPKTQAASNSEFIVRSILPIEGTMRYGEWFWDESAAPGAGRLVITVDLAARIISAFRDGHEIGTAVVLVGTQEHPTPLGAFPILTKERDNVSEKYNNAPMPFTLRLTRDGIAIHGSPVLNGYASHGCIGVPDEFAAKLFAAAKRGDTVIITRGKMIGLGDKVL